MMICRRERRMELWNASCPPGHDERANNSLKLTRRAGP